MDKTSEKTNIYGCYVDEKEQMLVAASLLYFGYSVFKRASVIRQFAALTQYLDSQKDESDFSARFPDVFYDSFIDSVRIGLCFENYFKAKMLLNKFLVHVIDKTVNESLFKEQKLRPIEVLKIHPGKTPNGLPVLTALLKKQTISYDTLLENQEYTGHFNMDEQILGFLNDLNKKGNKLHVYNFDKTGMGKKSMGNYDALIRFVDNEMTSLQNTLLKNLDAENKKRLSFK